jgi:hypothetical protein
VKRGFLDSWITVFIFYSLFFLLLYDFRYICALPATNLFALYFSIIFLYLSRFFSNSYKLCLGIQSFYLTRNLLLLRFLFSFNMRLIFHYCSLSIRVGSGRLIPFLRWYGFNRDI